jgi:copper resistance protein C
MKKLVTFLSLAIVWSVCAQAATTLVSSTPTNGSVTDRPPSTFVLEFSHPVQLHQLLLKRDDEKHWKTVPNVPYKEAAAFTIPAPALSPGGYTLEWTVFGQGSSALTGSVRFTVSAQQLGSTLSSSH